MAHHWRVAILLWIAKTATMVFWSPAVSAHRKPIRHISACPGQGRVEATSPCVNLGLVIFLKYLWSCQYPWFGKYGNFHHDLENSYPWSCQYLVDKTKPATVWGSIILSDSHRLHPLASLLRAQRKYGTSWRGGTAAAEAGTSWKIRNLAAGKSGTMVGRMMKTSWKHVWTWFHFTWKFQDSNLCC